MKKKSNRSFNEIFRKGMTYDNIKRQKKSKFTISLENKLLEKPQGGQIDPLPRFFRLKISYKL